MIASLFYHTDPPLFIKHYVHRYMGDRRRMGHQDQLRPFVGTISRL